MEQKNHLPSDLANLVYEKIENVKENDKPGLKNLNYIFENLFFASLKTEEGQLTKVTLTFINPESLDLNSQKRTHAYHWNCVQFEKPIQLTVKNLAKLSKAADPWSSSLAVYCNNETAPFIWGMIDQTIHNQSFLHHEKREKPEQPGLFQASTIDVGNIQVMIDYELIASLNQSTLISNYTNVFSNGPVSLRLKANFKGFIAETKKYVEENFKINSFPGWETFNNSLLTKTIARILIRIQNYKHGGAILITASSEEGIDIKHKMKYDRLHHALIKQVKSHIARHNYTTQAIKIIDNDAKSIKMDLYIDEFAAEYEDEENRDEVTGAIRFIASLSCIDGLVVVTPELKITGFGAVIKGYELPDYIYISSKSTVNTATITRTHPEYFGTRHRSMFAYCWNNEGSIGFVVSQDGDIRAVMKVNSRLVVWENIRVHKFAKSSRMPSRPRAIMKNN